MKKITLLACVLFTFSFSPLVAEERPEEEMENKLIEVFERMFDFFQILQKIIITPKTMIKD